MRREVKEGYKKTATPSYLSELSMEMKGQANRKTTPMQDLSLLVCRDGHLEDGRDMHAKGVRKHVWGLFGWASEHPVQRVCAVRKAMAAVGAGALTRKLLSLGLVARLRPRRILSFLSDTLDRVTLPGTEETHSAHTPSPCHLSRACCSGSPEVSPHPLDGLQGSVDLS